MFLQYTGNGKFKSSFLKRNFSGDHLKNERRRNEQNLGITRRFSEIKWRSSSQHAYCLTNMQTYSLYNTSPGVRPQVKLTSYAYQRRMYVSAEDVCASYDNLHKSWPVENRSRFLHSANNSHAASLHPPSALSSGYSSVNQSCASSAGTGSQRSRSPTPDQFKTLKEECPHLEQRRSGNQMGGSCGSKSCCVDIDEELVVCGGGDRQTSNLSVRGKWCFSGSVITKT